MKLAIRPNGARLLPCLARATRPEECFHEPHDLSFLPVRVDEDIWDQADFLRKQALTTLHWTNVVCSAHLKCPQAVEEIVHALQAQFVPPRFPSCQGSTKNPSGAWTIFPQGSMRVAGTKTRESAQVIMYDLDYIEFEQMGTPFGMYNFKVLNRVSAAKFPYELNLNKVEQSDPTRFVYDVELFPGVVGRLHVDPPLAPPNKSIVPPLLETTDTSKKTLEKEKQQDTGASASAAAPRQGSLTSIVVGMYNTGNTNFVGAKSTLAPVLALKELDTILRGCRIYTRKWPKEIPFTAVAKLTQHPNIVHIRYHLRNNKRIAKQKRLVRKLRESEAKVLEERIKGLTRMIKKQSKKLSPSSNALTLTTVTASLTEAAAAAAVGTKRKKDVDTQTVRDLTDNLIRELVNGYRDELFIYQEQLRANQVEKVKDTDEHRQLVTLSIQDNRSTSSFSEQTQAQAPTPPVPPKIFQVEVLFIGMVHVLNAESEEECEHVWKMVEDIIETARLQPSDGTKLDLAGAVKEAAEEAAAKSKRNKSRAKAKLENKGKGKSSKGKKRGRKRKRKGGGGGDDDDDISLLSS